MFSLFKLNPAPFCLLDEVDAPLDDPNTERFCELVRQMSAQTQFLFITHNKITMELAGQLVGVTMPEPGVSRIVEVDIEEALRMPGSAPERSDAEPTRMSDLQLAPGPSAPCFVAAAFAYNMLAGARARERAEGAFGSGMATRLLDALDAARPPRRRAARRDGCDAGARRPRPIEPMPPRRRTAAASAAAATLERPWRCRADPAVDYIVELASSRRSR